MLTRSNDEPLSRGATMADLEDIIRLVNSNQPMTVTELRSMHSELGRCPRSSDLGVRAARCRVAFRLEKLGA
jgi:hypothetical protein